MIDSRKTSSSPRSPVTPADLRLEADYREYVKGKRVQVPSRWVTTDLEES